MIPLEKHDYEIKNTITRIEKAYQQGAWQCATDLTKYLLKLLKDRNEYCRIKKHSKTILDSKIIKF